MAHTQMVHRWHPRTAPPTTLQGILTRLEELRRNALVNTAAPSVCPLPSLTRPLLLFSLFTISPKIPRTAVVLPPRCRNLHKEAKFGGTSSSGSKEDSSSDASSPPATPPPEAQAASRTTTLTPLALDMFLSGTAAAEADSAAAASSSSDDVQGLTQMYYLVEEEEEAAAASAISSHRPPVSEASAGLVETAAAAAGVAPLSLGKQGLRSPRQTGAMAAAAAAALEYQQAAFSSSGEEGPPAVASSSGGTAAAVAAASSMSTEPQGLTQVFYLDPEDEAEAAAALPVVPGRSFLRERLGVSGEVVQGLRQVRAEGKRCDVGGWWCIL